MELLEIMSELAVVAFIAGRLLWSTDEALPVHVDAFLAEPGPASPGEPDASGRLDRSFFRRGNNPIFRATGGNCL